MEPAALLWRDDVLRRAISWQRESFGTSIGAAVIVFAGRTRGEFHQPRADLAIAGFGLDAPNRLNFDRQSREVADQAIDEMASKVFLNLSEEQTDAGVKEARTEGPRLAILKERAKSRGAS